MRTLIRKNLATHRNNTLYAMINTYKIFRKKKNKFDVHLAITFLITIGIIVLTFGILYATK